MSGGGSNSSSKTTTTTQASTQQQDQRVGATDAGIAIGSGAQGGITINQLPDGLGDFVNGFIDLTHQAIQAAQDAGSVAVDAQTQLNQVQTTNTGQLQKYLLWAGIGIAGLFLLRGKF